jgi:hypothetical protein
MENARNTLSADPVQTLPPRHYAVQLPLRWHYVLPSELWVDGRRLWLRANMPSFMEGARASENFAIGGPWSQAHGYHALITAG